MYVSGTGVPADAAKARTWLTKAANQGVPRAQYMLAMMCLQGAGGSPNPTLALDLLHKAAEKRYVPAYAMLGQMYKLGRGTAKDPFLAYFWIDVATRSGYKPAEPLKAQLGKTLTSQQLKSAQAKAQAWMQSHPIHPPQKSTKNR